MNYLIIIDVLQRILLVYLGFSAIYLFVFSLFSTLYKTKSLEGEVRLRDFIVLIPAYKEDVVIIEVAKQTKNQTYPVDNFQVCVIADQLKPSTIKKLKEVPVDVIEVSFEQSSKARSINKALEIIPEKYDGIVILDADNIMNSDFLFKMNESLSKGYNAVQGHRIAKNQDSKLAILDAMSEAINNSIFRKGHVVLNLSSALIGSGMAFDFMLYKRLMRDIDTFAEDKELEFKLFIEGEKIDFVHDAYVLDEKVSNTEVFVEQRSRWITYQLIYAKKFFFKAFYELVFNYNLDFFDKVIQQLLPPRIIMLGLSMIILIVSLIFNEGFLFYAWIVECLLVSFAIVMAIPKKFYTQDTLKATIKLPLGFFLMFISLFRFKKAQKDFNPTPHTNFSSEKQSDNNNH